jgi:putative transposase
MRADDSANAIDHRVAPRFMPAIAKKVTTELVIEMLRERREGASLKDIERRHHLSKVTVWMWMSKYKGLDEQSYPLVRQLQEENRELQVALARAERRCTMSTMFIKHMEPSRKKRAWTSADMRTTFSVDRALSNKIMGVGKDAMGTKPRPLPVAHLVAMMKNYLAQNPSHGLLTMYHAVFHGTPGGLGRVRKAYSQARLTLKQRARRKITLPKRVLKPMEVQGKPDCVWSMDFVHHVLADGTRFQILTAIDDFNKEAVICEALPGSSSTAVVEALAKCGRTGLPKSIRTDNGKEFKGAIYTSWTDNHGVARIYSRPYHCRDNAYIEQFNGVLRKEVLAYYEFRSLAEAQRMLDDWRMRFNLSRPHGALGGLSPLQFAYASTNGANPGRTSRMPSVSPNIRDL